MTHLSNWARETARKDRADRSRKRSKAITEKGIESAIAEAFLLRHRIRLMKTDAGGTGVRGLLANPPDWFLAALGIPPLPFGLTVAILIPPGFPDRTAFLADGRWLFIEVKKPGGAFREGQKDFLAAAREAGHIAFWAHSVDEALAKFAEAS